MVSVGTLELSLLLNRTQFDRTFKEVERDLKNLGATKFDVGIPDIHIKPKIDSKPLQAYRDDFRRTFRDLDRDTSSYKFRTPELLIRPEVDHKPLDDLNKHLDLKDQHKKMLQIAWNTNPLTPRVDSKELDKVSDELNKVNQQLQSFKKNLAFSGSFETVIRQEITIKTQSERQNSERVEKAVDRVKKSVDESAKTIASRLIFTTIFGSVLQSFGKGFTDSFKQLTDNFGGAEFIGALLGTTTLNTGRAAASVGQKKLEDLNFKGLGKEELDYFLATVRKEIRNLVGDRTAERIFRDINNLARETKKSITKASGYLPHQIQSIFEALAKSIEDIRKEAATPEFKKEVAEFAGYDRRVNISRKKQETIQERQQTSDREMSVVAQNLKNIRAASEQIRFIAEVQARLYKNLIAEQEKLIANLRNAKTPSERAVAGKELRDSIERGGVSDPVLERTRKEAALYRAALLQRSQDVSFKPNEAEERAKRLSLLADRYRATKGGTSSDEMLEFAEVRMELNSLLAEFGDLVNFRDLERLVEGKLSFKELQEAVDEAKGVLHVFATGLPKELVNLDIEVIEREYKSLAKQLRQETALHAATKAQHQDAIAQVKALSKQYQVARDELLKLKFGNAPRAFMEAIASMVDSVEDLTGLEVPSLLPSELPKDKGANALYDPVGNSVLVPPEIYSQIAKSKSFAQLPKEIQRLVLILHQEYYLTCQIYLAEHRLFFRER